MLADCCPNEYGDVVKCSAHLLRHWKVLAMEHYREKEVCLVDFESKLEDVYHHVKNVEVSLHLQEVFNNEELVPPVPVLPEFWPPQFAKFEDKKGYSGRVISKYQINCLVTSVFNHHKFFIECKMQGITA